MLTLQILDGDEPFFRQLDAHPIVFGSDPAADVQLRAAGVAPCHARIEFVGGAPRLIALDGVVLADGEPSASARLEVGGRFELGAAVLVVGQAVERPAEPDDVLASAPRSRRQRPRKGAFARVLPALIGVLGLGAVVTFAMLNSGGVGSLPADYVEWQRLQRAGSFELARAELAQLWTWAGDHPERRAVVAAAEQRTQELELAVTRLRERVLAEADERTYAQFSEELQYTEKYDEAEVQQLAARIVRASLSELLTQAEDAAAAEYRRRIAAGELPPVASRAPAGEPDTAGDEAAASHLADETPAGPGTPRPTSSPATVPPEPVPVTAAIDIDRVLEDVDRLAGQQLFGQAFGALREALAAAREDQLARLQAREVALRGAAQAAHDALVSAARQAAGQGEVERAIADLSNSQHRFPDGASFAALPALLEQLRADQQAAELAARRQQRTGGSGAAAVDEGVRRASLAEVASLMNQVRDVEAAGDYGAGEALLRRAAEAVESRDPDFAGRLQLRADEFSLLADLHRKTAELVASGRELDVPLRSGRIARLHGVDRFELLATTSDGEERLRWQDLAAQGVANIAEGLKLSGRALVGAAMLLYRDGDRAGAEAMLARALKSDRELEGTIHRAIAGGRGESLDPGGYSLTKDGFLSARQVEAEKVAQRLVKRLDAALRNKDATVREAYVREALAEGPLVLGPIAEALRRLVTKEVEQLEKSALRKQVDKLAQQYELVEQARKHAKDLIFDEVAYFYPYKPPQVSSDKYAEYLKVQAEVDRRVASLRGLWSDERLKVRVPNKLQTSLERLDWLAAVLQDFGALRGDEFAEIEWARAMVPGDSVSVQSYCRTVADRQRLEEWQQIDRYNELVGKQVNAGEREQLRITNDYRLMFGHRPLALHPQIAAAARGHADEMNNLGYFSHFSPTPGRRTPFDRMKLAGYDFGVSENIASVGGAEGAHGAWCRSSGHHRNLLNASHTEFGVGNVGRSWVQNFGHGTGYRDGDDWGRAAAAR